MTEKGGADLAEKGIARLALFVSLAAFGFSVFQWWTTERDSKVKASIELSNQLVTNPHLSEMRRVWFQMPKTNAATASNVVNIESTRMLYVYYDFVAALLLNGRVDEKYFPVQLNCELASQYHALEDAAKSDPIYSLAIPLSSLKNLSTYVAQHDIDRATTFSGICPGPFMYINK
jgi:hypothetical protein